MTPSGVLAYLPNPVSTTLWNLGYIKYFLCKRKVQRWALLMLLCVPFPVLSPALTEVNRSGSL